MRGNWLMWTIAALLVLAVGGSMFALGRMSREGEPRVEAPRLSREEQELQKIKIAAAEFEIEEARKTPEGWVVGVAQESPELDLMKLTKDAAIFFQDLARSGVDIAAVSYVVRTNDLRDVWGHRLQDVTLLRIGLDRETFARINWEGFDPQNFPRVTGDFWVHDLVAERERARREQGSASTPGAPARSNAGNVGDQAGQGGAGSAGS